MAQKPLPQAVRLEVRVLEEQAKELLKQGFHGAVILINAQVEVLVDELDERGINLMWKSGDVHAAAMDAFRWQDGQTQVRPSARWRLITSSEEKKHA